MIKKTTVKEMISKINLIRTKKIDLSLNDKLTYAINKVNKEYDESIYPLIDETREIIKDTIRYPRAVVDEKGVPIEEPSPYNPDGLKFKTDDLLQVNKLSKPLWEALYKKECSFKGYIISDITLPGYGRLLEQVKKTEHGDIVTPPIFNAFEMEELAGILFPGPDDVPTAPALELVNSEAMHDQEGVANV